MHSMLFGNLSNISFLKSIKAFVYLLSIELLEKGIRYLHVMVDNDKSRRFSEWLGFEWLDIETEVGSYVMRKDLHDV